MRRLIEFPEENRMKIAINPETKSRTQIQRLFHKVIEPEVKNSNKVTIFAYSSDFVEEISSTAQTIDERREQEREQRRVAQQGFILFQAHNNS